MRQETRRSSKLDRPGLETITVQHNSNQDVHDVHAEAKFSNLMEAAPDAIVIIDQGGSIVIANTQAERLFGYAKEELLGQPIELLIPERFHSRHHNHRTRYHSTPSTRPMGVGLNLVARRKDGTEFPVEISLSPLLTSDGMLVTSVIRDATDRKREAERLEAQVQERTRHLNTLLDFSQELLVARGLDTVLQSALGHAMALVPQADRGNIYLYEPQGHRLVLHASTGFPKPPPISLAPEGGLFGLIGATFTQRTLQIASSRADLEMWAGKMSQEQRQRVLRLLSLEDLPTGLATIPLLARETVIGVLQVIRTTGDGPFASDAVSTLQALANLTGAAIMEERSRREAAALTSQVQELEEMQRTMAERLDHAEAGMLQAARLAAVGQLAASIAHEINNPLYAARNCLYLLEEDLPTDRQTTPYLEMARDQLTRIAGIIERMRHFYRPSRGEMEPYNINHLLEETLALAGLNLRHGAIKMIFAPASELPEVICNGDQLRQVFLNLVLNAIDAMPNGGILTVRTQATPSFAIIEVQDTGVGIPRDIRDRIFEPFFTSKSSGTGLGLAISAHIVTQHGGQIQVESKENEGSNFRVVLPYQPGP